MMTDAEFQKWKREMVAVLLTKVEILSLVGHIQLALRHPEKQGTDEGGCETRSRKLASLIAHDDVVLSPKSLQEWKERRTDMKPEEQKHG